MTTKRNTQWSNAPALNARQTAILEADARIVEYTTEYMQDAPAVSVTLAEGFNYEGRGSFIQWGWKDLAHSLKHIEAGERYADCE